MNHIEEIMLVLANQADPVIAEPMAAYMKNKFPFLGIKKPKREVLVKPMIADLVKSDGKYYQEHVMELWELPEREYQYVAIDLLWKVRKHWSEEHVTFCEGLVISKSWWDTVDFLAVCALGSYLMDKPDVLQEKVYEWTASPNMWLNRTAILVQLKYKEMTDTNLLLHAIEVHMHSKEFFHQKAIGWALREYAYTDPGRVKAVCDTLPLSNLSRREALKYQIK